MPCWSTALALERMTSKKWYGDTHVSFASSHVRPPRLLVFGMAFASVLAIWSCQRVYHHYGVEVVAKPCTRLGRASQWLKLSPLIAPVKCSLLPINNKPEMKPALDRIGGFAMPTSNLLKGCVHADKFTVITPPRRPSPQALSSGPPSPLTLCVRDAQQVQACWRIACASAWMTRVPALAAATRAPMRSASPSASLSTRTR